MKKLLQFLDNYSLKIGVAFLLVFTALYPKLPSVHIVRTWVYIRLEDFFILAVVLIWLIQLLRKKVSLNFSFTWPIFLYWIAGLASLIFSVLFIGSHLTSFFPHIAALNYLRRIEYMILFFVALSTIKSLRDVKEYLAILVVTVVGVALYGFGQKFYISLWAFAPKFFEKYPFCFPSFQTGNEEFAKGLPLCLPSDARITSTFGGHYDLAAYLVLVIPIFAAFLVTVKRWKTRILFLGLSIISLILLILTASRVSFVSYIIGVVFMLIIFKKKKFIAPVLVVSILFLLLFSGSTAKRFLSTIRFASVVTNSQGQLVGMSTSSLPENLKNKIAKENVVTENPVSPQNLPEGSGFIGLPQNNPPVATSVAVLKKVISPDEARRLKLANGSIEISTVSGSFLIRKVLVYDISFTTRFQAEWPNAWKAFLRNPLLGSGFSAITLATDNDYFRALGESGIVGLLSFLLIFIVFGITIREVSPNIESKLAQSIVYGVAGGTVGLFINAGLIDVFEASKVAENMWILLGIGFGVLLLYQKKTIDYRTALQNIVTSPVFMCFYLLVLSLIVFLPTVGNFFVADDFTWLKWVANSTTSDVIKYFINAQNFFYRPLDKTIVFYLYTLFSFQPNGYHIFSLLMHFIMTIGVYIFAKQILKNKYLSFITAFVFLINPGFGEIIFWFSTISTTLSALFIIFILIAFVKYKRTKFILYYIVAFFLAILSFLSYEMAVVVPFLIVLTDMMILQTKRKTETWIPYLPFFALIPVYYLVRSLAHAFSGGGDYAYNLFHFIPNMSGNFIGYFGLYVWGEGSLLWYNFLRTNLKNEWILAAIGICIFISTAIYFGINYKKQILSLLRNETARIAVYGILFAFVALLPFLGLGNIAERYLYLAGVGFSIFIVVAVKELLVKLFNGNMQLISLTAVFLLVCTYLVCNFEIKTENANWQQAGNITKNALTTFRLGYESLTNTDTIYLVNTPVRYHNTWVFPLGMNDALWFIYREEMPKIYSVNTISEAKLLNLENGNNGYIFQFDNQGRMSDVH